MNVNNGESVNERPYTEEELEAKSHRINRAITAVQECLEKSIKKILADENGCINSAEIYDVLAIIISNTVTSLAMRRNIPLTGQLLMFSEISERTLGNIGMTFSSMHRIETNSEYIDARISESNRIKKRQ